MDLNPKIAEKLIQGEICKRNLADVQTAYDSCALNTHSQTQFWQEPVFQIFGYSLTLGLGVIFGLTKCFSTCK